MTSTSSAAQITSNVATEPHGTYEPPVIVATFPKQDLAQELPENLTPHIHAVQNS
jgi:hypothetical protein